MEGAASIRLANWLYTVAPKDGTVFGTVARGAALDPLLGQPGAQFEATKFNWIGSANDEVSVCVAWHTVGITSFDDLLHRELVIGGTGPGDDTVQFGKVLAAVLGAKLKIIAGYPGGNDAVLAMERGELQGRCGWSYSSLKGGHADWLAEKKIAVLVQFALAKHPELPDVPLVIDLAKTEEQRTLLEIRVRPPGDGAAVFGAARRAARDRRGAAPRLHGNHGRPGVPRRRRSRQAGDQSGIRRAHPGPGGRALQNPTAARPAARRNFEMMAASPHTLRFGLPLTPTLSPQAGRGSRARF